MEIKDIRQFMAWCAAGPSTYPKRKAIFEERKAHMEAEIAHINRALDMLKCKCWYYVQAIKDGSEDATTPHASLFFSLLPQLLRHGEVVFLIPDQPVPLHEGQLVAQRAALHVQVVRQLLAVVGYVEFIAAGALDAL